MSVVFSLEVNYKSGNFALNVIKIMRILQTILLLILSVMLYAVPASRHTIRVLMDNGTYETLIFCGDENRSFYLTHDGYIAEPDSSGMFYVKTNKKTSDVILSKTLPVTRGIGSIDTAPISSIGSPNIPVIIVNFSDEKITVAETDEAINNYYDLYCNGTMDVNLYTGAGSYGSVRDYFVQQSDSLFTPNFNVIGPVTLDKPMSYYGANSSSGTKDVNFKEFCSSAIDLAMDLENDFLSKFDNDGNGTIDLVFFIYAGLPESDAGVTSDAIWPKELVSPTKVNDITISVMACCSELSKRASGNVAAGVGTMCHEVSHSLGLPDLYDTNYTALGMSYWSLMDSGNYCNNGKTPCALTTYERDFLNWRQLNVLTEPTTVRLRPIEQGGVGYKIINENNSNEYYVVENRQPTGWDKGLEVLGHGMLVMHIDYNQSSWTSNRVNTSKTHQRLSFIPANNSYIGPYSASSASELLAAMNGQLYPGTSENYNLTNESTPASVVFTGGYMSKPIKQITETENGEILFKFMPLGVLDIPESIVGEDVSENSFKLTWEKVENADCYSVTIKEHDSETAQEIHLDSISDNAVVVELQNTQPNTVYTCTVKAMNDKYEDSDDSTPYIYTFVGSSICDSECIIKEEVQGVFDINGILISKQADDIKTLNPGIYILKTSKEVRKISVSK